VRAAPGIKMQPIMPWTNRAPEEAQDDPEQWSGSTVEEEPEVKSETAELLAEVNAVARHLRDLQDRLSSEHLAVAREVPEPVVEVAPPTAGLHGHKHEADEASRRVQAIIGAAERTAAEIRSRAETDAVRIRDQAEADETRIFESIEGMRPAIVDLQHALERVMEALAAVFADRE
jgi:hypothetical protein